MASILDIINEDVNLLFVVSSSESILNKLKKSVTDKVYTNSYHILLLLYVEHCMGNNLYTEDILTVINEKCQNYLSKIKNMIDKPIDNSNTDPYENIFFIFFESYKNNVFDCSNISEGFSGNKLFPISNNEIKECKTEQTNRSDPVTLCIYNNFSKSSVNSNCLLGKNSFINKIKNTVGVYTSSIIISGKLIVKNISYHG
jgi:hypothetical protein